MWDFRLINSEVPVILEGTEVRSELTASILSNSIKRTMKAANFWTEIYFVPTPNSLHPIYLIWPSSYS